MRALILAAGLLSLPLFAQTSRPTRPAAQQAAAEKAAAEKRAAAEKGLLEALQAADPGRQRRDVAVREVLEKAAAQAAKAAAEQPNLAAQRAVLLKQAILFQKLAGAETQPPSPLLQGDYAAAIEALDAARAKLQSAADADAAFAALDEATKALMDARAALWRQKEAAKQPPTAQPARPTKRDG